MIGDGSKDIPISIVSGSASVRAPQHPNLIQPIRPRPEFVEKPGDKTVHIISALEKLLSTSGDRRKMALPTSVPSSNEGNLPSIPIASLPTPAWPNGENVQLNARSGGSDVVVALRKVGVICCLVVV